MKNEFNTNIEGIRIYNKSKRNSSITVVLGFITIALTIFISGIISNWSLIIVVLILPLTYVIFGTIYQPIVQNGKFFNQLINKIEIDNNLLFFTTLPWKILGVSVYNSKSKTININRLQISRIPLKILKNKWWYKELNYETIFLVSIGKKLYNNEKYLLISDFFDSGDLLSNKMVNIEINENKITTANRVDGQ